RLEEYNTDPNRRAYCSDPRCAAYIAPTYFTGNSKNAPYPKCKASITCVSCKQRCDDYGGHQCPDQNDRFTKPNWLPEYSKELRVKRCPVYATWVEHIDKCNFVQCQVCDREFCFVCFGTIDECCDSADCSELGDPEYEEEGYKRKARGLHRDAG
ncbi:hypothetical protein BCR34DRAFT_461816, partial [Clohesyomyces aquaticus]